MNIITYKKVGLNLVWNLGFAMHCGIYSSNIIKIIVPSLFIYLFQMKSFYAYASPSELGLVQFLKRDI